MRPPALILALPLLPAILASPLPNPNPQAAEPAPGSAISQDFSSVRGGGTPITTISQDLSSVRGGGPTAIPASFSRAATSSRAPVVTTTATASSGVGAGTGGRGPFLQIPFGVVYEDPEDGSRIHPFGRADLCVYIVNETFVEGAKVELGRCLNNTLPYPGKRNIFNLSLPFTAVPPSNYSTSLPGSSGSGSSSARPTPTASVPGGPITVPSPTSTSYWVWSSPSWVPAEPETVTSAGVATGSGSESGSRSSIRVGSSISRPASSRSASPSASASALPEYQEYAYEGLIRPLGQQDYCLSGSVYIPEDAPAPAPAPGSSVSRAVSSGSSPVDTSTATVTAQSSPAAVSGPGSSPGSGGGIAARQETSIPPAGSSVSVGAIPGSGAASISRPVASGAGSASRSLIVGSSASSRPTASNTPVAPIPAGARDITLQRCNASDPAQWWRLGTDRRVTQFVTPDTPVPEGWRWKLSLRNQTQCATFLRTSTDSARSPRRLFQMLPCISNVASQLIMVVNNGTLPANETSNSTGPSGSASRSAAATSVNISVSVSSSVSSSAAASA